MLFGSKKEPTHYSKLNQYNNIASKLSFHLKGKDLDNYFLKLTKMNSDQFETYRSELIKYRDRNLIHREHNPNKVNDGDIRYPEIEPIKETTILLISLIVKVIKDIGNSSSENAIYSIEVLDSEEPCDIDRIFFKLVSDLKNEFVNHTMMEILGPSDP